MREDLENAMRELRGLIRDTDRRIQEAFEETFTAAAENFEEVAAQLFPGGRGRLRLVRDDSGPRPVLGGGAAGEEAPDVEERADAEAETVEDGAGPGEDMGVEIEITPGRQGDQAPDAALGRREVADRARVPVRGLPRPAVPLLHPRRGRGRARRPQHRPLPEGARPVLRPRPVHRRHPPEAHDGGRRLPLRRLDGGQRRLARHLAAAPAAPGGAGGVTIRPARAGEEAALTELAVRSKGHWGHDAAFLERARPELTVRPEHLRRWIVRVAERDGAVAGFAAVDPAARELEMLFVDPAAIGTRRRPRAADRRAHRRPHGRAGGAADRVRPRRRAVLSLPRRRARRHAHVVVDGPRAAAAADRDVWPAHAGERQRRLGGEAG